MNEIDPQSAYFIDLGKVYFTAEVVVNDKPAGKRINAPYILNITKHLKKGENTIEAHVTPGQLNSFIGEAAMWNKRFSAFKKDSGLMSSGLLGPVLLYKK